MNRENFAQLAVWLDEAKLEQFDMDYFFLAEVFVSTPAKALEIGHPCGTVACALGHSRFPALDATEGWKAYGQRVFGISEGSDVWVWCFGANWASCDNTPAGAAARIRYMLDGNKLFRFIDEDFDTSIYAPYLN